MCVCSRFVVLPMLLVAACASGETPVGSEQRAAETEPAECPTGEVPLDWNVGVDCDAEPSIQVRAYNSNTFVLRQSLCTSFEAPFMYLLFGDNKVLLEDTGAGDIPIRPLVDAIIEAWLAFHGKDDVELVVVNSHAHGDHVQGNPAFFDRPNTSIVGLGTEVVRDFFGIANWPEDTAEFDLGNRIVDVVPIPGHQGSDIALYDRPTGLLLTGDSFYAGRLFIRDFDAYQASIDRMLDFTAEEAERPVCGILGTHIEMTQTPGVDFPFGSVVHENEHELALSREHMVELQGALSEMEDAPEKSAHDDFVIFPL